MSGLMPGVVPGMTHGMMPAFMPGMMHGMVRFSAAVSEMLELASCGICASGRSSDPKVRRTTESVSTREPIISATANFT